MIYYNSITKKRTDFKYRFKSIFELTFEFGEDFRYTLNMNWGGSMDYLCGSDVQVQNNRLSEIEQSISVTHNFFNYDNRWGIDPRMIIENKSFINYNEKKILVY